MFSTLWKRLLLPRSGRPIQKQRARSVRLSFDLLEDRLTPATFTVNNLSDAPLPPARGLDLRQAIALADLPGNAGSTINFSVNGNIILRGGQLIITQPMTIDATGHIVAVDGAAKSRDFLISTPGTVTFINLTIKNGSAAVGSGTGSQLLPAVVSDPSGNGGGIDDVSPNSILILTNDHILLNTAAGNGGGVYSNGIVTLNGTTVDANKAPTGFGGGIYAGKNLTLNSSFVTNNTATRGGGIYQTGTGTTVTLNQSTVAINKATSGSGGGVWALFNVTANGGFVSNNQALGGGNGGGIYSDDGNVTLSGTSVRSNTATGEGGGVWADFNVSLKSGASVSNNIGNTGGGGIWADDGSVKLASSTVSGNTAGAGFNSNSVSNTGNGGGIWSGTNVTLDSSSTVSGNTANGNGGGIWAKHSVTINGGTVSDNHAVSSTFDPDTGDPTDGSGGGIYALQDVTLNGGTVTRNDAGLDGGGIWDGGGNVDVNSAATVSNNTAGRDGGGIWDANGNVTIDASTVTANEANRYGGGVFVSGQPEEIGSLAVTSGSTISFNRALVEGGGIYVNNIESVTIDSSTIDSNSAGLNGGGVSSHMVFNLSITNSSITNNDATSGSGGGLYLVGCSVSCSDVYLDSDTITGNSAGVYGGGVYLQGVDATINNCTFDNNIAYGGFSSGSALFVDSNAVLDLNNSDFDDTLGLSAQMSTELIDVGNTVPSGTLGVITSSGGNSVWDSSYIHITNFGFAGSGDVGNDQA